MKKWFVLCLVFSLMMSYVGVYAEYGASDTEDALRRILSVETGVSEYSFFCYDDYDGDGKFEAFALTGAGDGSDGYTGELWFVSEYSCEQLRSTSSYLGVSAGGPYSSKVFMAEEWFGGSGSKSYLWYVRNGQPKYLNISTISDFSYDGGNSFSAYPSAYDMMSDGTGHTWKRYYYYFDSATERIREYGGLNITKAELLEFEGAEAILAQALDEGWEIGDIYYRANGVINVNLHKYDQYSGYNDNLTLHYDESSVVDTAESHYYGGSYEWANTPELAEEPVFIHPVRKNESSVAPSDGMGVNVISTSASEGMGVNVISSNTDVVSDVSANPVPDATTVIPGSDVFEFNKLSSVFVHGSEMTIDGAYQDYVVHLRDYVFSGGSDGYFENWVTEEGILCDTLLDLDGDGQQEYLTYEMNVETINEYDYSYTESIGSIVVYEMNDGVYIESARIKDIGDLMPMGESGIRIVNTDSDTYIVESSYGIGDGAVAYLGMRVYRYDGTQFEQELYATISSMGTSWIAKGVTIEKNDYGIDSAIYDYRWENDENSLKEYGLSVGDNLYIFDYDYYNDYGTYEERFDYSGFDKLSDELAPFGMSLSYRLTQERYMDVMLINGGETFIYVTDYSKIMNATELRLLTTLDHKPEMFSAVPPDEDYYDSYYDYGDDDYEAYTDYEGIDAANSYAYITGDVNMRDQPSLNGQVIISIPQGSTVEFLGNVSTDDRGVDWYNVNYGGHTGWTSSKYTELQ